MMRDSLTGLLNHTSTRERLGVEAARAQREGLSLSFAMIDIDHFKSVNDTYGHPAGDRVIKSLARLLQQRLRKMDVIGRYGGEEFAIVLQNIDVHSGQRLLDEIRDRFAHIRHAIGNKEVYVTFSCGLASFPTYEDATMLTQAADQALYQAKRGGRNQVRVAHS
jgi:diguanylate cyclase (GGDEF)-like protein